MNTLAQFTLVFVLSSHSGTSSCLLLPSGARLCRLCPGIFGELPAQAYLFLCLCVAWRAYPDPGIRHPVIVIHCLHAWFSQCTQSPWSLRLHTTLPSSRVSCRAAHGVKIPVLNKSQLDPSDGRSCRAPGLPACWQLHHHLVEVIGHLCSPTWLSLGPHVCLVAPLEGRLMPLTVKIFIRRFVTHRHLHFHV